MGKSDRCIQYEKLSEYQDWLLLRSGGFFAFGKPPDFFLPWSIPLAQCGTLEDVIGRLERRRAERRDAGMEKRFLRVLKKLEKEQNE